MLIDSARDIPKESIALALAFLNLGAADSSQPFGRLIPGDANRQIAALLEENAAHFAAVLAQQAVSDALADPTALADGTPVFQMHRHCDVPVYTFAALQCALDRLFAHTNPLVVIAHPHQLHRARMDIQALAPERQASYLASGPICYQDNHWSRPFYWAAKNALGWTVDGMLVASRRWVWAERVLGKPLAMLYADNRCPDAVQLGPLSG